MRTPSARETELLDRCYRYALEHGLSDLSLRPLATAVGSSPRVLLFLFGSKDELVARLLDRARADELALLPDDSGPGLHAAATAVWDWLADPAHAALLRLWVEAYARSLTDADGAWGDFASRTVEDWLAVLARAQPATERRSRTGRARRTATLAVLRGGLLDLLATGDRRRVDEAVRAGIRATADLSSPQATSLGP